ncbi:zinc finger protein 443-like isoform X1 [Drosophila pseudoobscura]|uniref:Zinc finger protein 443-like isoform X1 n=1 Tax=Drosophila pseudoobscura pseudoobscura TaxID=46245 RepID=A0A6I8W7U8_DROPS|nr:zinc finger protein 443 isoform X1 [Drosophila pseudoobscura]
MNNQCRACGSAMYNTKGRNLFQKKNAKLLLNFNLVTNNLALKKDPRVPSCICASCAESLNRAVIFRARALETQENLLQQRAGLPENDLPTDDETPGETSNSEVKAQDADSLMSGLENELGGKTGFDGTDAYETAQVADSLITSLQKDSGHEKKKSSITENIIKAPKQLADNSTFRSSPSTTPTSRSPLSTTPTSSSTRPSRLTSKNAAQSDKRHPLPKKILKRRSCTMNKLKCKFCEQTFVSPFELSCHMRSHTAETSCKCSYCDRAFSTKGNTIRHERTHTRQAAFVCPTCDMSFTLATVLKRHISLYHTQMSMSF